MDRGKFVRQKIWQLSVTVVYFGGYAEHDPLFIPFIMKRLIRLSVFFLLGLMATSCLTIEESYFFRSNGSGSMTYTMDLSELKSLLAMQEEGVSEEQFSEMSYDAAAAEIVKIGGVEAVEAFSDKDNLVFGIRFDFKNLQALNDALNILLAENEEGEEAAPYHTYFTMENGAITRIQRPGDGSMADELFGEEDEETAQQAQAFLESMKYRLKFRFKKPVQSVYSSSDARLGGKKNREVEIETNFRAISEDASNLDATVILK
ncbi:MAG: hypothetical protein OHK0039_44200 [Bacteroidia bacterium]